MNSVNELTDGLNFQLYYFSAPALKVDLFNNWTSFLRRTTLILYPFVQCSVLMVEILRTVRGNWFNDKYENNNNKYVADKKTTKYYKILQNITNYFTMFTILLFYTKLRNSRGGVAIVYPWLLKSKIHGQLSRETPPTSCYQTSNTNWIFCYWLQYWMIPNKRGQAGENWKADSFEGNSGVVHLSEKGATGGRQPT